MKTTINIPVLRNLMKQMGLGSGIAAMRLGLNNNDFQAVLGRGYTADKGLVARIAAGPFAAALDLDAKAEAYEPLVFEEEIKSSTPEEDKVEEDFGSYPEEELVPIVETTAPDVEDEPEQEPAPEEVAAELDAMPKHGEEAISLEGMSATAILRAVDEKKISVAEALAQESSREKPRKGLTARLEELL